MNDLALQRQSPCRTQSFHVWLANLHTVKHQTSDQMTPDLLKFGQLKFRKFEENSEALIVKLWDCRN